VNIHMLRMRTDSRSITMLAIFSAMVAALEIFPVVGITDLKFFPGGTQFTIDWTGIPIVIVFIGLGMISSVFSILVMFVAIGYRNIVGAVFKGAAELFTIVGLLCARFFIKKTKLSRRGEVFVYLIYGIAFRTMGMYFVNIPLLNTLYGIPIQAAIVTSTILMPWNALQAIINIIGGLFFYYLIPESLRTQAGLDGSERSSKIEELSKEEIDIASDSEG
jgi:riboflavin transporter FmnP